MKTKRLDHGRRPRWRRALRAAVLGLFALLAARMLDDRAASTPAIATVEVRERSAGNIAVRKPKGTARSRRGRRGSATSLCVLALFTMFATGALGFETATGSGTGPILVGSLTGPTTLSATAASPFVKVEWTASGLSNGTTYAQSYTVERYNNAGTALGAACGGETIPASHGTGGPPAHFSCEDSPGEAGTYKYKITATYDGWSATSAFTNTATTLFGPASKLVFTTQPVGGVAEGTNFGTEPVVKVEDAQGNVVTNDSGHVTLAINSGPSAGSLSCTNSGFPTVTVSSGVATFTGCQIAGTAAAGTYTLAATRSGLSSTGASSNVVINVGSASKLAFTTQPSGGSLSTAWEQQPVVSIEDSYGNVATTVASTSITLTLSTGSGTLSCTTDPVSSSSGVSTFAGCKINATGTEDVLTASGTYTSTTSEKFKVTTAPSVSMVATGFVTSGKTATSSSFTPVSGATYIIFAEHTSSAGDSASVTSGPWSSATLITSHHLSDNISWQWAWIATANTNSSSTAKVEFEKETSKTSDNPGNNVIEVMRLSNANTAEAIGESTLTSGTTTSSKTMSANLPNVAAGGSDVVFPYVAGDTGGPEPTWAPAGISNLTSVVASYSHAGGPETGYGTTVAFAETALSGSVTWGHQENWPANTGTADGAIALGINPQGVKPKVTGVSPAAGSTNGTNTVTVTGENLSYATAVDFGATAGSSVSVNGEGTSLTVTAPAHAAGQVNLTVTTPIGTSATNGSDHYTFDATPTVTSISPAAGATGGGKVVTVTGTGFLSATEAKFGTSAGTSIVVDSDTELTITSPSHSEGTVDLTVVNPTGTSATGSADHFTYYATPTVTTVSPAYGTHSGGTTVTVTGTHLTGAEAVYFNATEGTSISVNGGGTELTVTSPSHAAEQVNVTVITPGGTSATSGSDHFTFENTPTVTAVSPAAGTTSGATTVTVTGTGFLSATEVKFGTSAGTSLTIVSDTELTIKSPSHSAGEINITVISSYGTSATSSADLYTYDGTPTITHVSPPGGTPSGGTVVTLTGTGFKSATEVKFGTSAGTSLTVVSDTELTITSPSHSAAEVNVTVTNPTGTSSSTATYTYTNGLIFLGIGAPTTWTASHSAANVADPSSVASGDLLVLVVIGNQEPGPPTNPTGWNAGDMGAGPSGGPHAAVYWKIAGSSETNVSVTPFNGGSSAAWVIAYAPGAGGTPAAATGSKCNGHEMGNCEYVTASTTLTPTMVATNANNATEISLVAIPAADTLSLSTPQSFKLRETSLASASGDALGVADQVIATSGTTPTAPTWTSSGSTKWLYVSLSFT